MLTNDEFENRIVRTRLNETFSHKVNLGFGVDDGKVKGVHNFPIYNKKTNVDFPTKTNIDSYMYEKSSKVGSKYNVKLATVKSAPHIQPYFYDENSHQASAKDSNSRVPHGLMSSLYGLPPDKDIILENPEGQALHGITEKEFMLKNFRQEAKDGLPDGLQRIIDDDDTRKNTSSIDTLYNYSEEYEEEEEEDEYEDYEDEEEEKGKKQKPYSPVIVKSAFDNTKETITSSNDYSKIEPSQVDAYFLTIDFESMNLPDFEQFIRLRGSFKKSSKPLNEDVKNKINSLLKKFDKSIPGKGIKSDDNYLQKVKEILSEDNEIREEKEKQKRMIKITKKLAKKVPLAKKPVFNLESELFTEDMYFEKNS